MHKYAADFLLWDEPGVHDIFSVSQVRPSPEAHGSSVRFNTFSRADMTPPSEP